MGHSLRMADDTLVRGSAQAFIATLLSDFRREDETQRLFKARGAGSGGLPGLRVSGSRRGPEVSDSGPPEKDHHHRSRAGGAFGCIPVNANGPRRDST